MALFGASFEDKVLKAISQVQQNTAGIDSLSATIDGKTVTLTGTAASLEAKTAAMQAFHALVKTDNTINMIRVERSTRVAPKVVEAPPPSPQEVIREVQRGETLSGIAQQQYGKANLYMKSLTPTGMCWPTPTSSSRGRSCVSRGFSRFHPARGAALTAVHCWQEVASGRL